MNISELKLSVRSYNLLQRKGITEVEELVSMTDDEIIDLYDGNVATGEIREAARSFREAVGDVGERTEMMECQQ